MSNLIANALYKEQKELENKLDKLEMFLHSDTSWALSSEQANLMQVQAKIMESYIHLLAIRRDLEEETEDE